MPRWRSACRLLFAILGLTMSPLNAVATNLETLLMPGPVIAGHAKYEQECSRCHDRADRSRQAALCRTCHEPVAADIAQHKGFHGRLRGAETAQCSACHTEHKGRQADVVKLETASFPHAQTDFPLQGAHATVACAACHLAGRKHREAASACIDCHKKEEPHEGKLGRDCAGCHEAGGWTRVRFDHAKTRFALTGKHEQATCAACHMGNRYKDTPTQCAACHAPDDVHAGARGAACAECHQTTGWTGTKYDHLKATRIRARWRTLLARLQDVSQDVELQGPVAQGLRGLPPQRRSARHPLRCRLREVPCRKRVDTVEFRSHARWQVRTARCAPEAGLPCLPHGGRRQPEARHGVCRMPPGRRRACGQAGHRLRAVPRRGDVARSSAVRSRLFDVPARGPARRRSVLRVPSLHVVQGSAAGVCRLPRGGRSPQGIARPGLRSLPFGERLEPVAIRSRQGHEVRPDRRARQGDLRGLSQAARALVEAVAGLRGLPCRRRRAPRSVRPSMPALPRDHDFQGRAAAVRERQP